MVVTSCWPQISVSSLSRSATYPVRAGSGYFVVHPSPDESQNRMSAPQHYHTAAQNALKLSPNGEGFDPPKMSKVKYLSEAPRVPALVNLCTELAVCSWNRVQSCR